MDDAERRESAADVAKNRKDAKSGYPGHDLLKHHAHLMSIHSTPTTSTAGVRIVIWAQPSSLCRSPISEGDGEVRRSIVNLSAIVRSPLAQAISWCSVSR
jgi:hypothetical protein